MEKLGSFDLLGEVARDQDGPVHRGLDRLAGRSAAVRLIEAEEARSPEWRARLGERVRIARSIEHPAIARPYEHGECDGGTWVAAAEVEGTGLPEWLSAGPTLGERARVVSEIADGLAAAHEQGLAHEDLHPGRISVLPSGHVRIADLHLPALPHGGTASDGRSWRAPELGPGTPADARANIHTLGLLARELLGSGAVEDAPGPGPSPRWREVLAEVERCLAIDPDDRPVRARELGERVTAALAEERERAAAAAASAAVPPPPLLEAPSLPGAPPSRRRATGSGWQAAAGAAALLASLVFAWRTVGRGDSPGQGEPGAGEARPAEPAVPEAAPDLPAGGVAAPAPPPTPDPRVGELLREAGEHARRNDWTLPAGACALDKYVAALRLDPASEAARAGIASVVEFFLRRGRELSAAGDRAGARVRFEKAREVLESAGREAGLADHERLAREAALGLAATGE